MAGSPKSPATGFLIMAGVNIVTAISFVVFYFLYDKSGGSNSYFLLIASVVCLVAAVLLVFAYNFFRKRLDNLKNNG